jgi:hypothetical protein
MTLRALPARFAQRLDLPAFGGPAGTTSRRVSWPRRSSDAPDAYLPCVRHLFGIY